MTPSEIKVIEDRLSLQLPHSYRDHLIQGVTLNGFPIGIYFQQDFKELLVLNLRIRQETWSTEFCQKPWPADQICIGEDGVGNYYSIQATDESCAVSLFDHEGDVFQLVAASLSDYFDHLLSMLQQTAEMLGCPLSEMFEDAEQAQAPSPTKETIVVRGEERRDGLLNPIDLKEWVDVASASDDLTMRGYVI
ncbi:MAG: hypothetical protein CMJ78_12205 [Planctomycetaceae bacterium]|nr:hypothetical protein [Planctomycetaceae bacterium]